MWAGWLFLFSRQKAHIKYLAKMYNKSIGEVTAKYQKFVAELGAKSEK